mgnify:CR=1 FL=1
MIFTDSYIRATLLKIFRWLIKGMNLMTKFRMYSREEAKNLSTSIRICLLHQAKIMMSLPEIPLYHHFQKKTKL